MIQGSASPVGRQLEVLWTAGTLTGLSDAQLLGRFAGVRDATAELAFRELMNRHGPMVMGVCRQILRRPHDADDAFQATFLVLVRKGGSIRVGESLAPWLYAVAYRTAQRNRAIASRYRPAPAEFLEIPGESSPNDPCHFDLRPLLHEELNRLPGKYRDPIVLCHLEGKTHEEAARLLHWPLGTVSGRLSRGRELLRSRLKRRGIEVSPAVLVANWLAGTPIGLAPSFIQATAGGAIGLTGPAISASVQTLAQGVQKTMLLGKLKLTAAVLVLVGGMVTSAAVWGFQSSPPTTDPAQADPRNEPAHVAQFKTTSPFRPARKKNSPNINLRQGFAGVRTSSMVLVESPDRTAWEALSLVKEHPMTGSMDKVHPGWMRIELSPGTTAQPVVDHSNSQVAALAIQGKTIDQIAVFNPAFGVWEKQRLLRPVEGEINPFVSGGLALYQAGNDFYVWTAQRRGFGVLHLEGAEEATVSFGVGFANVEVIQGNRLYVFSPNMGYWSTGVEVHSPPSVTRPVREKPAAGAQEPPE